MPTRQERFGNASATSLSAAISSTTATSISVVDATQLPAANCRVIVDSELMLVTAKSGNTLTVQRGIEGTTAATHSSGAAVTHIVSVGSLKVYGEQNSPLWDGSRPPFVLNDASGNVLTSSSFTNIGLADSLIADQDGTIRLRMLASASSTKLTALARSYSTPATLIAALQFLYPVSGSGVSPGCIVGFRQSSTSKMFGVQLFNNGVSGGLVSGVYKYDSETSLDSIPVGKETFALATGGVAWFKVQDDNTNLTFSVGDGIDWVQLFSEARGTFMTGGPNQFIWGGCIGGNGLDALTRLVAWSEG